MPSVPLPQDVLDRLRRRGLLPPARPPRSASGPRNRRASETEHPVFGHVVAAAQRDPEKALWALDYLTSAAFGELSDAKEE